jgi:hypothetical protein
LPRGILQLGHAFLRLAEINQGESWHTTWKNKMKELNNSSPLLKRTSAE